MDTIYDRCYAIMNKINEWFVTACAAIFCIANTVCRNGKCEPISNGSGSASCPANEEYVTCSTCETSCGKPTLACPMMCGPPKCECVAAKGFARDVNGRCIPRLQCPVNGNPGRGKKVLRQQQSLFVSKDATQKT